jgi:hypothetical protein
MNTFRILLSAITVLCLIAMEARAPAHGQQACWPILQVSQPRLSDTMINLKRYWFATLEVNANSCVESSGSFELSTTRARESGPDFVVAEAVAWNSRQTDIVIELWADEAIIDYRIVSRRPCTCRY